MTHGLCEQAHARRRAVARACLGGGQRRIGVEVVVGAQDLGEILVDDDRAVHLAELEETICGERDVHGKTIIPGSKHVLGVADADKGTQVTGNYHVEGHAKRSSRRRHLDCTIDALLGCEGPFV